MKDLNAWEMPLSGTALIEASAGTGKTYTLTTLYLRLLVEENRLPSEILVVTYTQAATAELRERVRARMIDAIGAGESAPSEAGEEDPETQALRRLAVRARDQGAESGGVDPLRRALQEFDEAAIFTIHGFCQRMLQENAFESGVAFDAELVENPDTLEREVAHDLFAKLLSEQDATFAEWLLGGAGKVWEFDPRALHQGLLRQLGADEAMPVLPLLVSDFNPEADPGEEAKAGALPEAVGDALVAWAQMWSSRRASISELLLSKNDLSKVSYKAATIETSWFPELDRFARQIESTESRASLAALPLPKNFSKLTPESLAAKTNKKGAPPSDSGFAVFGEVVAAVEALNASYQQRALALRNRFVQEARELARLRREEQHLLFFDDLLSELRRAVQGEDGARLRDLLRERYPFALIDEFQDTDPVQYDIFRHVWHDRPEETRTTGLVLIGDPKQAIYAFRGADVFTYLAAREDAGDAAFGLPINWRSDPGLIASVNEIFNSRTAAFRIDAIEFHPVASRTPFERKFRAQDRSEAGLRVLMADRESAGQFSQETVSPEKALPPRFGHTHLMKAVARDIAELLESDATLDGRRIEPSDIAILCRRKVELQRVKRALQALGIPCVDRGDSDVFDSREAWEFVCVLRAMMRPGDPALLRSALSTGAHGLGRGALSDLTDDSARLAEVSERYSEYGQLWTSVGFGRAFEAWRREEGVTAGLLAYQDGERRLTNWLHLAELLQQVSSERSPSRSSLVGWLERAIASEEAREAVGSEASLLRLERDDHAISLVTLHRSKGLEYPFVYLPFLWENSGAKAPSSTPGKEKPESRRPPIRFHDPQTGKRTLDLAGPNYSDHALLAEEEGFSEQLRLLYVGLTRAKHQCVVSWGAIGSHYSKSPLAWLLYGALSEAASPDRKEAAESVKKWADADWAAAWECVAERAGEGSVVVESAVFEDRDRWASSAQAKAKLVFTASERRFDRGIRTTSFSGLVREGYRMRGGPSGHEVLGRDLDAEVGDVLAGAGLVSTQEKAEGASADGALPNLAAEMHAFPRGADVGTLLHDVLEQIDFAQTKTERVRVLAEEALGRSGLDLAFVDQVVHVVESVRTACLREEPSAFRLADVAPGQLVPEIEFTLVTPGGGSSGGLTPASLGDLLETAREGSVAARYAERARRMGFPPLSGFLRGFIDATFFDGERYYLVDYKSNHLGDRQEDYLPDALVEPMIEHDYVLQSLLYSVALDRHLSCRLVDYDYDRHFGGAYYLFLRGLSEKHLPGCGIFFDRPDQAIVRGLSDLMGHRRGEAK